MDILLQKVKKIIEKYDMLQKGDIVVAGISGGPDSICMLHVLKSFIDELELKLFAVHLNHKFRGKDADDDAIYVEKKCKEWGIPSHIEVFDVPKYIEETGMSPEEAGREIRYNLFQKIYDEVGGTKIAVAQNLNDNVETILMRFMRGTGIDGLKGIEPVRNNIIRPLIGIERKLIEEYCREYDLNPRIDKTNFEPIYIRNKIRLELIPYIKDNFNPSIEAALTRFAGIIDEENDYLQKTTYEAFKRVACVYKCSIQYNIEELKSQHNALRRRLIRMGLEKIKGTLKGIEFKNIELVLSLLEQKTGAAAVLPGGIRAYISYNDLIITEIEEEKREKFSYELKYDNDNFFADTNTVITVRRKTIYDLKGIKGEADVIFIDEESISDKLIYRNRNDGDVFSPIGMRGSKKLKDYFIDEKIPRAKRDNIELIADGKEVVWLIGSRISEKYKITKDTKKVLEIKVRRGFVTNDAK